MQLAYREFGTGQPLIILHGLFGQSDNWNTLAKRFGAAGFHVFTVDQRNHGLSPHSDVWDYTNMAADLLEFIQEHKLQNPILMGHSMGGKTVMFFELNYPGVASKIIIADIAPRVYDSHHDGVLKGLLSVDFTKTKNRKEAEETLNLFIEDFGTKQFLLKNIYWKDTVNNIMDWRFNLSVINKEYNNIGVNVPEKVSKVPALLLAVLFFIVMLNVLFKSDINNLPWVQKAIAQHNMIKPDDAMIGNIGVNLITTYLLPFEAISILLMMALVGAAHLSRKEKSA